MILANLICHWANFNCCKWPKTKQLIQSFDHTAQEVIHTKTSGNWIITAENTHLLCKRESMTVQLAVWPDWAIYWTLGNFSKPLATINLPKSPTFLGNCHFLVKSFLGNFYGHLAIFFWSHWQLVYSIIELYSTEQVNLLLILPTVAALKYYQ